jgi:hypothetical protein
VAGRIIQARAMKHDAGRSSGWRLSQLGALLARMVEFRSHKRVSR